ncbi:MAG: hypothetical protein ABI550_09495, partial [Ignavibacteriaceae bacterium]
MKKFFYCFILIAFFCASLFPSKTETKIINKGNVKYLSNVLIVKMKEEVNANANKKINLSSSLNNFLKNFSVKSSQQIFSQKNNKVQNDLSRIVLINYDADIDPLYLSKKITKYKQKNILNRESIKIFSGATL